MMLLYNMGAGGIMKFHIFYILFIAFSIISIFVSNSQAYAVEGIWRDYESMKELVKDIRNGDKDDDKMNYDKFKDSSVYKNAKEDLRRCIDLADKVGEKLGDYEIVRCFENTNYFKEKYVDGNNENVSQQEQQNETNQNQSGAEEAVQQKELQLTENNSELQEQQEQQEQQNETNQNQSGAEETVQQKELQLAENNSEQQGQQNVTNQNQNQNQTNDERKTRTSESNVGSNDGCDPSYPDICITTYSEKLSCADIPFRNFKVLPPDTHGFDSDSDGVGCEG
jgi:FtsZ-interacting cell division protein ZipA